MTLAETAKLLVQMDLGGNLAKGIQGIERQLTGMDRSTTRLKGGFKDIGAGFLVAGIRATALLAAQAGTVVTAVAAMAREGQEAAKVQKIYATAVANSGRVSTQYVEILKAQRTELMNLAGIDDEVIQSEQTRLIQMGLTGEAVAKLTPLILDMSEATGIDLLTATVAVGKAANGSATALQRYGVFVDKAKFKVDPLVATQEALNQKFGGTTKALSGELSTRLKAFNENLSNIREEAGIKLLPALTRIVDVAGTQLVPAFGKFVDRILPEVIAGIDKFAGMLENGGAERGINAITDALGPMVSLLQIAAAPIKAIVGAFLQLPTQVQGVLIGAFAINKLSGGLLATGVGEVAKVGLGSAANFLLQRGGTPATPLFVMDVQNRLPNGQFAPGTTAVPTPLGSALKTAGQVILPLALAEIIGGAIVDATGGPVAGTKDAGTGRVIAELGGVKVAIGQSQAAIVRSINGLPGGIKNALGGILYQGGGRPSKDDPIMPRRPGTTAPHPGKEKDDRAITVKAVATTRDISTAHTVKSRFGPTVSQAGGI